LFSLVSFLACQQLATSNQPLATSNLQLATGDMPFTISLAKAAATCSCPLGSVWDQGDPFPFPLPPAGIQLDWIPNEIINRLPFILAQPNDLGFLAGISATNPTFVGKFTKALVLAIGEPVESRER